MEKYVKLSDLEKIIEKLTREPYYQPADKDFYSGVCAVYGEIVCLQKYEFVSEDTFDDGRQELLNTIHTAKLALQED